MDEFAVEAIESPLETSDELPNRSPMDEFDAEARILSADEPVVWHANKKHLAMRSLITKT